MKANFWEVFGLSEHEEVPDFLKGTALLGKEFTISSIHIRDGIPVEHTGSPMLSAGVDGLFTMGFRYVSNVL